MDRTTGASPVREPPHPIAPDRVGAPRRWLAILPVLSPFGAGAVLLAAGFTLSRRFEAGLPLLRHAQPQVVIWLCVTSALLTVAAWCAAARLSPDEAPLVSDTPDHDPADLANGCDRSSAGL